MSMNPETHLDLWKYFTDDAAKIKDRMWTISSWMFTLQGGLMAYIAKYLGSDGNDSIIIDSPLLVVITSFIGVLISIYTMYMIQQYGQHIRSMWNRADLIRRQVSGLSEIWFLKDEEKIKKDAAIEGKGEQSIPPVAMRLIWASIGFLVFFGIVFFVALFNII